MAEAPDDAPSVFGAPPPEDETGAALAALFFDADDPAEPVGAGESLPVLVGEAPVAAAAGEPLPEEAPEAAPADAGEPVAGAGLGAAAAGAEEELLGVAEEPSAVVDDAVPADELVPAVLGGGAELPEEVPDSAAPPVGESAAVEVLELAGAAAAPPADVDASDAGDDGAWESARALIAKVANMSATTGTTSHTPRGFIKPGNVDAMRPDVCLRHMPRSPNRVRRYAAMNRTQLLSGFSRSLCRKLCH